MKLLSEKIAWAETQPWFQEMGQCPQEPEWHAEGDVRTHTLMVCAEMERLLEGQALPDEHVQALHWAALLHDIGKPRTTVHVDGRLTSPKHAIVGQHLARRLLMELNIAFPVRECACSLICYHSRPFHIHRRTSPERDVIETSWKTSNALLYLLARADNAGRLCANALESDGWIDLWREECQTADCFHTPYPFTSDQARVLFFKGKLVNLHYTPYEEERPGVLMLSGLPGAGKTTWAAGHHQGRPVVELDEIRKQLAISATEHQGAVVQQAQRQCKALLAAKQEFLFSATNITESLRARWIDLFLDYGYSIHIRYFEPPLTLLFQHNTDRESVVPEKAIWKMIDSLDVPHLSECHQLVING